MNTAGTVFKTTPSGTLTTLYNSCSQLDCADGYGAQTGLLQATDGNFTDQPRMAEPMNTAQSSKSPQAGCSLSYTISALNRTAPMAPGLQAWCRPQTGTSTGQPLGAGPAATVSMAAARSSGCRGPNPTPFQFIPATPCRVVDTRNPNGEFGGPPIQGGTYRFFPRD
jgi:hypothetical protein